MVRESRAPPRPPDYNSLDFRPPKSPRYQRSKEESGYYNRRSPEEEEKKTSDADKILTSKLSSNSNARRALETPELIKIESRSSPFQDDIEREGGRDGIGKNDNCETRASPGGFLMRGNEEGVVVKLEDDQSEEAQAVDDIAMSPIPYDREDPMSLMDLPDDLLALPISACGPHDDPSLS